MTAENLVTPELLFLLFAMPGTKEKGKKTPYDGLTYRELGHDILIKLRRHIQDGTKPSRRLLRRSFPKATMKMRIQARTEKIKMWSMENVLGWMINHHGEDDGYPNDCCTKIVEIRNIDRYLRVATVVVLKVLNNKNNDYRNGFIYPYEHLWHNKKTLIGGTYVAHRRTLIMPIEWLAGYCSIITAS